MKRENIIISDIKLFSKNIVLGAYTFSRKNKFPWVAMQKSKVAKSQIQRNFTYLVCSYLRPNPDPNPNPCVEINRQTEVNLSPRKFDEFGGFFLNTA